MLPDLIEFMSFTAAPGVVANNGMRLKIARARRVYGDDTQYGYIVMFNTSLAKRDNWHAAVPTFRETPEPAIVEMQWLKIALLDNNESGFELADGFMIAVSRRKAVVWPVRARGGSIVPSAPGYEHSRKPDAQ